MNNEPENNYNLIALIGIISTGICIILFGKLTPRAHSSECNLSGTIVHWNGHF